MFFVLYVKHIGSLRKVDSSSSYSLGKGLIGGALLGPVGAVAGIGGKKESTYKCEKCGYIKTYRE